MNVYTPIINGIKIYASKTIMVRVKCSEPDSRHEDNKYGSMENSIPWIRLMINSITAPKIDAIEINIQNIAMEIPEDLSRKAIISEIDIYAIAWSVYRKDKLAKLGIIK